MDDDIKGSTIQYELTIIVLISLIFGGLGFLYSFLGLFDQGDIIVRLEPLRALSIQEIGGHFLFGFIVGLPSKNMAFALLIGLMTLTIDADHLLNLAGLHIQGRIDHSILFAVSSSILMGYIVSHMYNGGNSSRISRSANKKNKQVIMRSMLSLYIIRRYNDKNVYEKNRYNSRNVQRIFVDHNNSSSIFLQFFIITLAAFLSHIAYDVFVDDNARFPLLAPFLFSDFHIPESYSLSIEAVGILLMYLYYYYILRYLY
jgi:hypothetical protein